MVQSLRGDLDKPAKAVPIEQAALSEEVEETIQKSERAVIATFGCRDNDDDASTACPDDDDRCISDFNDPQADWTEEYLALHTQYWRASGGYGSWSRDHHSVSARALLAKASESIDDKVNIKALSAKAQVFPVPRSWDGIQRVLIEHCAPDDSELCKETRHTRGCLNVRCTASHDMAKADSVDSLLGFIRAIPRDVVVCLWSGIPCTGGSPIQALNQNRPGHAQNMANHLQLWGLLYGGFLKLAQAVVHKGGHLAIEWPSRCRYWSHPKVEALLDVKPL